MHSILDLYIVGDYVQQLCTKPKGDQKSFRRAVVQVALMKAHNKVPRPGPSFAIPDEVDLMAKDITQHQDQ